MLELVLSHFSKSQSYINPQKLTYNWDKHGKPIISKKNPPSQKEIEILSYLIRNEAVQSEDRSQLWFYCSGAKFEYRENRNYLKTINDKFPAEIPNIYENQIELDISRTFSSLLFFKNESIKNSLRTILVAYSRRNLSVGYCQGFNYIVGRLLMVFNREAAKEEKVFCMLYQILESILPLNYYSGLTGVAIDLKVFQAILESFIPDVAFKLKSLGIIIEAIITQWFITLFSIFDENDLMLIWDLFFLEGNIVIFKFSFAIFQVLKIDIINAKTAIEIYKLFSELTKKPLDHSIFINQIYRKNNPLNKNLIEKLRKNYEREVLKNIKDYKRKMSINFSIDELEVRQCNTEWPICLEGNPKKCKIVENFLILRKTTSINIIEDYFSDKNASKLKKIPLLKEINFEELLIERCDHRCKTIPGTKKGIIEKKANEKERFDFVEIFEGFTLSKS